MPEAVSEATEGTATFLFTDIEGSTRLLQEIGTAYPSVLAKHMELLHAAFERHGGRVIDRAGDGLFVVFPSAKSGVAATIEAQRALLQHAWPGDCRVRVRMGIHTGEAIRSGSGFVGLDVHRAARVSAAAHGAQIVVSETTRQLIAGDLPAGLSLLDLGEHQLKDMPRPERLYQIVADGLPGNFPPLRTAGGLPRNLPARPHRLVGRDTDLESIRDLVIRDDVRLLTLTGPGGTGKTSLAVEVAARCIRDFRDGVAYVPLAALGSDSLVTVAIAQTLAVTPAVTQSVQDALIDHLRDHAMLLVLDNFEHVLDAGPEVAALCAACPRVTVLVTSRFALNLSIEHEFPVAPLRAPDPRRLGSVASLTTFPAVELFTQRAVAVKPGFGLDEDSALAVAEICHQLDGLPLAIELAAARVKIMSPRALLARLDRRLEILSGGARDLPARHRTLRQAIGWSYDLLDPGERAVFRRLAAFAGGFSLDAADAVCPAAPDPAMPALDGVAALVDKSLLRQDPGEDGEPRFVMLETVRDFAIEQLEASGEAGVTRNAHADFFIDLAEQAAAGLLGASQSHWLDRLDREHDNFRAALDWSVTTRDTARALRLAAALGRFWIIRGFHSEARQRLSSVLSLPCPPEAGALRVKVLSGAAILAYEQNDLTEATSLLESTLAWYRESGNDRGAAETLNHMGWVAFFAGDIDRATSLSQEALRIHEQRDDRRGMALSLTNLGGVAHFQGDFPDARDLYVRALNIRRELQDPRGIAYGMLNVGSALRRLGDHAEAASLTQQALDTVRKLDDRQLIIYACAMIGEGALDRGDPESALEPLNEAIRLAGELGQPWTLGLAQAYLAEAFALMGDAKRGVPLALEGIRNHERANIYLWRVLSHTVCASVHRIAGLTDDAVRFYHGAVAQASACAMRYHLARCAAGLADIMSARGDHVSACRLAGAARACQESTGAAPTPRDPDPGAIIERARMHIVDAVVQAALDYGAATPVKDLIPAG